MNTAFLLEERTEYRHQRAKWIARGYLFPTFREWLHERAEIRAYVAKERAQADEMSYDGAE
jgi:ribosomal protein S3